MATLVLSTVGSLIGGPIGSAIGSLIGNQIDQGLFSPKAAKGARLDNLAVQASSYGADLPRLFGTMRVAGSVIWSTDLKESEQTSGGGKGRPSTTNYAYSASFAVVLSARTIRAVHRIWADGSLLRGAAGDWKGGIGAFRLYLGDEAQAVDPLIAAAQGIATTPAHRGLAYAVFEDLQLGDFGNRIPSLSFEVEADAGPVTLGAIAADLSGGEVGGAPGPSLIGYAATGNSLRGAIEGLAGALPVAFADGAGGLALVDESAGPILIDAADLGSSATAKPAPRLGFDRQAAGTLNEALSISYYDPARDWQIGSQSARREAAARRVGTIDLAAAVDASTARGICEARLAREWAGRSTATVSLPWRHLDLAAGALIELPGEAGAWRVTERAFEAMVVTLTAQRLPDAVNAGLPPAASGSAVQQPDVLAGPTSLALLDLPSLGHDAPTSAALLIAAAGASTGWRGAPLLASLDEGASWQAIGQTAPAAVMGAARSVLPSGSAMLRDDIATVDVELLNDAMQLSGNDAVGASATANLALLGDELIQFTTAQQIGPRLFRLSGLPRGRRGSEWAMAGHAEGERFVLVEPDKLFSWALPAGQTGGTIRIAASGIGDDSPAEADILFQARALRPPAPVAIDWAVQGDGSLRIGWTRRSRTGWDWLDDTDAPLAEESERYRLTAGRSGPTPLTVEVSEPAATLSAADLAGLGQGPLTLTVAQIGTSAASLPPASTIIPLGD